MIGPDEVRSDIPWMATRRFTEWRVFFPNRTLQPKNCHLTLHAYVGHADRLTRPVHGSVLTRLCGRHSGNGRSVATRTLA